MIIDENKAIEIISSSKIVFLLEPPYKRKYVPLGLAKISTFVKNNDGFVIYGRSYDGQNCDLVCVTSLFTYDSEKVIVSVLNIKEKYPNMRILVGGIYATLMPYHLQKAVGEDVFIFRGYSKVLDECVPDYTIDYQIDDKWKDYSFVFTTRGCPNNCGYCAVKTLEPSVWINPTWKNHIIKEKKFIMISDNNLSSVAGNHLNDLIDELVVQKKKVIFDNGFDCKYISDEMANRLSKLKFNDSGMRLAFDRISEDGIFQGAIKKLRDAGIPKYAIMAYCLFNFNDCPKEADYRMRECVKVGARPYPQQYTPLNLSDRKTGYVGKYWTKNLLRCFRYFWLMAGYYTKMSFDEFARSDKNAFVLLEEDWNAWKFY